MILISRFHETGERIKMKLFKKALVATALVTAFGAQAVNVSSEKVAISKEGTDFGLKATVATGVATTPDDFVLDFVIGELTTSGSYIKLTFGDNVGLANVVSNVSAVDNQIGSGQGVANVENGGSAVFSYGTGSFTFDKFVIDEDDDGNDTIEFEVNLGNAITAGSAFRLTLANFGANSGVELAGAGEVCYESRVDAPADSAVIESGCSTISELKSQFSFSVSQPFDGKIERVAQDSFARKSDNNVDTQDTLKFKISNDETLAAALAVTNASVLLEGNFENVTAAELADANIGAAVITAPAVVNAGEDEVTFELTAAEVTATGTEVEAIINFDANASGTAITIPVTTDIDASVTFTSNSGAGTTVTLDTADAGSWSLDATVINVPYLPLGFDETSSSVHIANDGNASANVIATIVTFCDAFDEDTTCIDQTRSESVELGDVPANTVAKIKQGALMTAFGITDPTKVSVTLNIDADAEDISAYATVQNSTGRTEVSNSQAKVDGK
jgi:hypothetical protein